MSDAGAAEPAHLSPSLPSGKELFDAAMEKARPLIAHNERVKPTS